MTKEIEKKENSELETQDSRTWGMSPKEIGTLDLYIKEGLPGISTVKDSTIESMMNAYMSGQTFSEISHKNNIKKNIVLYLAYKFEWAKKKNEHLTALIDSLNQKIEVQKLENASFIVEMAAFIRQYFQDQMLTYLKTKDPAILAQTEFKLLTPYMKFIEAMNGNPGGDSKKGPEVSVYAGEGSMVTLSSDGSKTPIKDMGHSKLLKIFADMERAKEEEKNKEDKNKKGSK